MSTRKPAPTVESYAKVNAECARIILARPDLNPVGSLAEKWARKVIEQAKEQAK